MVDRAEDESSSTVVAHHMADHLPFPSLQSLVGEIVEPEAGGVVGCGLLGIAHPERDVVLVSRTVPKARICPKLGFSPLSPYIQICLLVRN